MTYDNWKATNPADAEPLPGCWECEACGASNNPTDWFCCCCHTVQEEDDDA